MVRLVNKQKSGYFRWHDSGDLQCLRHLEMIVDVCRGTPHITHWLPTKERGMVLQYLDRYDGFPPNLRVRLSAYLLDRIPQILPEYGVLGSCVHTGEQPPAGSVACPAYQTDGYCDDCRMCWEQDVKIVSYPIH